MNIHIYLISAAVRADADPSHTAQLVLLYS